MSGLTESEKDDNDFETKQMQETVYDIIKDIQDPEFPQTLEELNVVYEDGVKVTRFTDNVYNINIEFKPTVPHCTLASLIGQEKTIFENLPRMTGSVIEPVIPVIDISIKDGAHLNGAEISKQINDKERVAAAMENPNLREAVNKCLEVIDR